MTRRRPLAWAAILLLSGVLGSALLYERTRGADMAKNAQVVSVIGRVRQQEARMAQLVLAARFGLLNQYDALVRCSQELRESGRAVRDQVARVVANSGTMALSLDELEQAIGELLATVERFKADNSILRNSSYYVPTLASRVHAQYESTEGAVDSNIYPFVAASLIYNLVGDADSEAALRLADQSLLGGAARGGLAQETRQILSRHVRLILKKQPLVDGAIQRILSSRVGPALAQVERVYAGLFAQEVARGEYYRRWLYAWSLVLLVGLALIAVQLRRLYLELGSRVEERTEELGLAVAQLWGEMKLAAKIQEALVPAHPTLLNADVAAQMRSAEKVGGDYFDVIEGERSEWILIGDVSGHGVPAGLIMMMCQTAVRTALRCRPSLMPHELLAEVNGVLTANIRQLGEDKYMTISALRRDMDGTFHVAGAHQDLYIFRARAAQVEAIETQGIWLGLRADIADSLKTKSFRLDVDDVLLLYTDGITEASKAGQLFDTAGVRRVLSGAAGKSASELLLALFAAIEEHTVEDDATALVIRQLPASSSRRSGHPFTPANDIDDEPALRRRADAKGIER